MNNTRVLSFTAYLFALLLLGNVAHSATFAKKLADVGSLQQTIRTNDGGYVLVINDKEQNRIVLGKINSAGKKVWQRQLASPDQEATEARGVGLAIDGGIFLTVDHPPYHYNVNRVEVLKLDGEGRIEWNSGFQRQYSGPAGAPGIARFDIIIGTADGGALAAGSSCYLLCEYFYGPVVVKFSGTGAVEWSKSFDNRQNNTGFKEKLTQLIQTSDGGFIVRSRFGAVFVKLKSSGEIEWQKSFNKRNWDPEIYATEDGGLILLFLGSKSELLWAKLDSTGNPVWEKATTFENFPIKTARLAVNLSRDGGYVLFGSVSAGTFLAKADTEGTIRSVAVFESTFENLDSIYPNADGGTVLFGSLNQSGNNSVFFSGLDSSGKLRKADPA